jgi:hypothetical protein
MKYASPDIAQEETAADTAVTQDASGIFAAIIYLYEEAGKQKYAGTQRSLMAVLDAFFEDLNMLGQTDHDLIRVKQFLRQALAGPQQNLDSLIHAIQKIDQGDIQ